MTNTSSTLLGLFQEITALPHRTQASLQLRPSDLIGSWQRCGFTADFITQFDLLNIPANSQTANTVSTVLNELIENAVKYSADKEEKVTCNIKTLESSLVIEIINTSNNQNKNTLESIATSLLNTPKEKRDTYIVKMFDNNKDFSKNPESKLGIFTIIQQLDGKIGIKIDKLEEIDRFRIHICVEVKKERTET